MAAMPRRMSVAWNGKDIPPEFLELPAVGSCRAHRRGPQSHISVSCGEIFDGLRRQRLPIRPGNATPSAVCFQ